MNKHVVLAVAKRDLRSWFGNPTNYVFIMLFVAVSAGFMMWSPRFFLNNLANLDTWSEWFPTIAVVFVSAATMGMWTSERANGTQELLFTLPARDSDLLAGKFLAQVAVWTASLAFTLAMPVAVALLGAPDVGQVFANYVGFWLFGVMLVSVSMIGSQMTANATMDRDASGDASQKIEIAATPRQAMPPTKMSSMMGNLRPRDNPTIVANATAGNSMRP